jgi:hypothetical protein
MTIGSYARATNNFGIKYREFGIEILVNSHVQNVDVVIANQPAGEDLEMIRGSHLKNLGWNIKRAHWRFY